MLYLLKIKNHLALIALIFPFLGCASIIKERMVEHASIVSGCKNPKLLSYKDGEGVINACGKKTKCRWKGGENGSWWCAGENYPPTWWDSTGIGRVREKFDEYTGDEYVQLQDMWITGRKNAFKINMIGGRGGGDVLISLFTTSEIGDGWQYLKCHRVGLLADGSIVQPYDVSHDGSVGSLIMETISAKITKDDVFRMSESNRVRIRICGDEFKFNKSQIRAFKKFSRLLK